MRILITGGSGFLGSNLTRMLLDKGHFVLCLDNGYSSSHDNIKDLRTHSHFLYVHGDVNDIIDFGSIDQIYHLACPASPIWYQKDPLYTFDTCVRGTRNILEVARLNRAKFLYTSTSEVYGDPSIHPQPETYFGNVNTQGPRSCFTDGTEILTENGWKLFEDLENLEKVATLNPITDNIEYHIPDEIIKYPYKGDTFSFNDMNIDLEVTPNHKMMFKIEKGNNFLLEASTNTNWNNLSMYKSSDYEHDDIEFFNFPEELRNLKNCKTPFVEKIEMDLWLEFFGYFITEGCVYGNRIQISQSETVNKEKFDAIQICLNKMPFKFCVSKSGNSYFVAENKRLAEYLRKFGIPQILIFNKMDLTDEKDFYSYQVLRPQYFLAISALKGTNLDELREQIINILPYSPNENTDQKEKELKLLIFGPPNSGKSTLMNYLLQENRSLATPVAGTTQEPVISN